MVRWLNLILVFGCIGAPTLAQVTRQPDRAGRTHASQLASARESQPGKPAAASSAAYPLVSFQDFSAVMLGSRAEPGEGRSQAHIYRFGKQLRMDEPGGAGYFITDLNTGETYGMFDGGCIRDDLPYVRAIPFYLTGMAEATVTRAPAGKETVDGRSCQVEDVTVSSPLFPAPQKMRFWEAEDLHGFPIRIEFLLPRGHGPVIRYKNVVLGPQEPNLFAHPKSCQPLPQPQTPQE